MYELIPEELKQKRQWVCAYKGAKAPMKPYEYGGASTTDPATWGDFETACAAVEAGYYDDIGYVFAGDYVGIDIDIGFEAGGLPTAQAVDLIARCRSYTELSRSGRGYHIFLKGTLPFDGQNNGKGLEIYKTRRYFITTGKRIAYGEIIENQEAINYVIDKHFGDVPAQNGENKTDAQRTRIYSAQWRKPDPSGRVDLTPQYPDITPGSRHICMVSLAGSLRNAGYGFDYIYSELCRANRLACKPPLAAGELQQIVKSMKKYDR